MLESEQIDQILASLEDIGFVIGYEITATPIEVNVSNVAMAGGNVAQVGGVDAGVGTTN